jgi:hypothetical protein
LFQIVEAELVPAEEFESDKKDLKALLEPKLSDSLDALEMKFSRWPAMVVAGTATDAEYKERQQRMISQVMTMPQNSEAEFKEKIIRVMLLKDKSWLSEMDYHGKKVEILKDVESITDYVARTRLHMVARDCGFITAEDFEGKKQALIKEVFAPYESMEQFQEKVDMLLKLKDGDIITDDEFNAYKGKLMNDL